MVETINTLNTSLYTVPQSYKKIVDTKESYTSVKERYNNLDQKLFLEYPSGEELIKVPKTNDWEQLKNNMDVQNNSIYDLIVQGKDVEQLNPYELQKQITKQYKEDEYTKKQGLNEKIDRLKEHHDAMYLYGVKHSGETLTINSLYKGSFSGNDKSTSRQYSISDINSVLKMNGLDDTRGNQWAAGKLLQYDMDVSKDSVVQMQNIQAAVNSLQKYENYDEANTLSESKEADAGDRPLIKEKKVLYTEMDIQEIVDEISEVKDEDIAEVMREGKEVTIGNLKEMMHQNTKKVLKGVKNEEQLNVPQQLDSSPQEKIQDVKNQIKEIRARLTVEAAQKLSEKMPVESTELSKIAKELMVQEEVEIRVALHKVNLLEDEVNVNNIKQVMDATRKIAFYKEQTVQIQLHQQERGAIEEVHKALLAYEDHQTPTEKRFGETVARVAPQIEDFLVQNNIPLDEKTIQAAKALISNQMELNETNLEQVKPIVEKVNTLIEEMTPDRVATLMKEGINPYKVSINAVLENISTIAFPQMKGNVAEMMVALEEKGMINEEQRQGMIGLYKVLHAVEVHREEVIGYLFKNESPLTVEKLQEATKYVGKDQWMDKVVDDQFGELEELKYLKDTAKVMIEKSQKQADKLLDVTQVLEKIQLPVNEEQATSIHKLNALIYPFIKNYFKQEMGKFEGLETLPSSLLEKLDSVKQVSTEVIELMNKENIPITLSNIHWMQKLVERPELYGELLRQNDLVKKGFPKDIEEVEKEVERLATLAKESKDRAMQKGNLLDYKNYKQLEELTNVQKEFMDKQGFYQIPFMIGGEQKLVHLQIKKQPDEIKRQREGIQAVIRYETKELGSVTAHLSILKDQMSYEVTGETKEITDKLRKQQQSLDGMLEKIGYLVTKSEYAQKAKENIILNPMTHTKVGDTEFEAMI